MFPFFVLKKKAANVSNGYRCFFVICDLSFEQFSASASFTFAPKLLERYSSDFHFWLNRFFCLFFVLLTLNLFKSNSIYLLVFCCCCCSHWRASVRSLKIISFLSRAHMFFHFTSFVFFYPLGVRIWILCVFSCVYSVEPPLIWPLYLNIGMYIWSLASFFFSLHHVTITINTMTIQIII